MINGTLPPREASPSLSPPYNPFPEEEDELNSSNESSSCPLNPFPASSSQTLTPSQSPPVPLRESNHPFMDPPPKSIWSVSGMLSLRNLRDYLVKNPPNNLEEIILWSFSQRKFPTETLTPSDFRYIDDKGFATSRINQIKFILDAYLSKIHQCSSYEVVDSNFFIGFYPDRKCMIPQLEGQQSSITCIAMLLRDRGVEYNLTELMQTKISSPLELAPLLRKYGYKIESFRKHPNALSSGNSILANIADLTGRNTTIIVDSIDHEKMTIRHPSHGWRITIPKNIFDEAITSSKFLTLVPLTT